MGQGQFCTGQSWASDGASRRAASERQRAESWTITESWPAPFSRRSSGVGLAPTFPVSSFPSNLVDQRPRRDLRGLDEYFKIAVPSEFLRGG